MKFKFREHFSYELLDKEKERQKTNSRDETNLFFIVLS